MTRAAIRVNVASGVCNRLGSARRFRRRPSPSRAPGCRDRDKIFGAAFDRRVDNLGLTQLRIAPRSPWQNGFAERWVGTARREIVDHVILLGEHHLRRVLREYVAYYNADRPHISLEGDAPTRRDVEPRSMGRVVAMPRLGGLHHRYGRVAA